MRRLTHPRHRSLTGALLLALCTSALAACPPKLDHLELCTLNGSGLSLTEARLDRGEVIAFRVIPVDDDGGIDKDRRVSIRSGDPGVLRTAPLHYEDTHCRGPDDSRWHFVIYGVERGHTTLHLNADGYEVAVPVTVD